MLMLLYFSTHPYYRLLLMKYSISEASALLQSERSFNGALNANLIFRFSFSFLQGRDMLC